MIKGQRNNVCVYLHKYPKTKEVFYVGIGVSTRPFDFERRSTFWKNTVNKHGVEVEIVNEDLTFEQACIVEQTLIRIYGRRDKGQGSLVNMTNGGVGIDNTPIENIRILVQPKPKKAVKIKTGMVERLKSKIYAHI
jgi:hypothetical protein